MRQFDIVTVKMEAIQKVAKAAQTPTQCKTLAQLSLAIVEDLWANDRYQDAVNVAAIALAAAQKTNDASLVSRSAQCAEHAKGMASAYGQLMSSLNVLQQTPADPDANLAVGRFYCLVKRDWTAGLPMLALANGSPWKPLAARELAGGAPAIELADGWWELAQREEEPAKRQFQIHAAGWYRQALSTLDAAAKARAQNRIAEAPPEPRGRL